MPDDRTYIKVHDGMPDHPKVEALSDAAFRLLVTLWCWCGRHLTDGRIPEGIWSRRGSAKARDELLTAGLVEANGTGFYMHDYLEHQRSAEQVAELKAKRRAAGSMGGKAKARAVASAIASAKQTPKQTASKPLAETDTDTDLREGSNDPSSSGSLTRPDVERLCEHLLRRLVENDVKVPDKIGKRWRDAARLLMDRDGRSEQQIHAAIDWSQTDPFWRANIHSMPTLRDQYDKLRQAAERQRNGSTDRQAERRREALADDSPLRSART